MIELKMLFFVLRMKINFNCFDDFSAYKNEEEDNNNNNNNKNCANI